MRREIIGDCELWLGDCRDVLPTLGKVEAVVSDPPYEFQSSGGGSFRASRMGWMEQIIAAGLDKGFDHTFLTPELCDSVVCFCHNDQIPILSTWFASKFERFAICMWHKSNPMPVANKHYTPDTELYIHAWNGAGHPIGDLKDKGRWFLHPVGSSDIDHPTVKPLPLMEKVVRNVQGQTILDPFMGSGTTGVACVKLGRKFIGIELEERYFQIACKRIEKAYAQPDFFCGASEAGQPSGFVVTDSTPVADRARAAEIVRHLRVTMRSRAVAEMLGISDAYVRFILGQHQRVSSSAFLAPPWAVRRVLEWQATADPPPPT